MLLEPVDVEGLVLKHAGEERRVGRQAPPYLLAEAGVACGLQTRLVLPGAVHHLKPKQNQV